VKNNILILGAGGSLGSMLRWRNKFPEGSSIYLQSRRRLSRDTLIWDLEISPLLALADFIMAKSINKILMLYGGRSYSVEQDIRELSLIQNCLGLFVSLEVQQVLVASSAAVYGLDETETFSEESATGSSHEYGCKKLKLESFGQKYGNDKTEISFLRLGNVLGADSLTKFYVNNKDHSFILNKYVNGYLGRSYLTPSSFHYVIFKLLMLDGGIPKILNVATHSRLFMDEILAGIGVDFAIKNVDENGRNVFLETDTLNSLIKIPRQLQDAVFAYTDLRDYRKYQLSKMGDYSG